MYNMYVRLTPCSVTSFIVICFIYFNVRQIKHLTYEKAYIFRN